MCVAMRRVERQRAPERVDGARAWIGQPRRGAVAHHAQRELVPALGALGCDVDHVLPCGGELGARRQRRIAWTAQREQARPIAIAEIVALPPRERDAVAQRSHATDAVGGERLVQRRQRERRVAAERGRVAANGGAEVAGAEVRLRREVCADRGQRRRHEVRQLVLLAGLRDEQSRREPIDQRGEAVHRARHASLSAHRSGGEREHGRRQHRARRRADHAADDDALRAELRGQSHDGVARHVHRRRESRRAPRAEHRARIHRARERVVGQPRGQQLDHAVAQIRERRIGPRHAERRDHHALPVRERRHFGSRLASRAADEHTDAEQRDDDHRQDRPAQPERDAQLGRRVRQTARRDSLDRRGDAAHHRGLDAQRRLRTARRSRRSPSSSARSRRSASFRRAASSRARPPSGPRRDRAPGEAAPRGRVRA